MDPEFSPDDQINRFFDLVVDDLRDMFGYSYPEAVELSRQYYTNVTNSEYRRQHKAPIRDIDYFQHAGSSGIAQEVHYYFGLKRAPNPVEFVRWRSEYDRQNNH